MPPIYDPYDWYWKKRDGTAYHSRRQREVPAADAEYQAWLAEGHVPRQYPVDNYGKENRDWMLAILAPWCLRIYPLTEDEQASEKIEQAMREQPAKDGRPTNILDKDTMDRVMRVMRKNQVQTIAERMRAAGNSGWGRE